MNIIISVNFLFSVKMGTLQWVHFFLPVVMLWASSKYGAAAMDLCEFEELFPEESTLSKCPGTLPDSDRTSSDNRTETISPSAPETLSTERLSSESSTAESPCGAPSPTDVNVLVIPDRDYYVHGEVVQYLCPHGYDIKGNDSAVCMHGAWEFHIEASCAESSCGSPASTDVNVIFTPDQDSYAHGEEAEFSCSPGYDINGNDSAVCMYGSWEFAVQPYCTESPCGSPASTDVNVIFTTDQDSYAHGEEVEFSCSPGYDINGNDSAVCMYGSWEFGVQPYCTESPCGSPASTDVNVIFTPDQDSYAHGEEVEFSCSPGYDINGNDSAVCMYGSWEVGDQPYCTESPCGNAAPTDVNVIVSPDQDSYTHGTEVEYSCPRGYEYNGQVSAACMYGTWGISDEPSCIAKFRADLRCGGSRLAPNGEVAQCDPDGRYPCCSPAQWCGNTPDHCDCSTCIDYREN